MIDKGKLIGKRVQHRVTHEIGIIEDINDAELMLVRYYDKEAKYRYPEALFNILEIDLDDDEELEEIHKTSDVAGFKRFITDYKNAINHEVNYLKINGGKKYNATDGVCIVSKNGTYIYAFDTDSELKFPDGTPIKIYWGGQRIIAYIQLCEEYTIMFSVSEFLGYNVEEIEFTADQWIILEALLQRLEEMSPEENTIAYKLACEGRYEIDKLKVIEVGQENAIKKAQNEAITFIWGPPGTGKTYTLAEIAKSQILMGKRVLMLSYSNVSVDGALLKVAGNIDEPKGVVVRYGYARLEEVYNNPYLTSYGYVINNNPRLTEELEMLKKAKKKLTKNDPERLKINEKISRIRKSILEKEHELINNAAYVATTISKAIMDPSIYSQKFDMVIVDEASMAYVPQIVFAGGLSKHRFVCLGDFNQLPAIVQNNDDNRLKKDIFDYVGISSAVEWKYSHNWLVMLNLQYRMHQDISDFSSEIMYGGRLISNKSSQYEKSLIAKETPVRDKAMVLADLSGMYSVCNRRYSDSSRYNILSAFISLKMAEKYVDKYSVGIITPYNAQSRFILAMLRDIQDRDVRYKKVTSATVHQFQGSQRHIIIYDAVDCYRMQYPGTLLTKLEDDLANRLFNVALTRAEGKFIIVANKDYMFRKKISSKLMFTRAMKKAEYKKSIIYGEELINENKTLDVDKSSIYMDKVNESWKFYIDDLKMAKEEVLIEIPDAIGGTEEKIKSLECVIRGLAKNNVKIIVHIDEDVTLPDFIEQFKQNKEYVTMPLSIIDNKVIWYGQPLSEAEFITNGELIKTKYFPTFRFEGEHAAKMLKHMI